jgi:murein DD-endopeptidase MepM/ murein hydrolase activator NlpD
MSKNRLREFLFLLFLMWNSPAFAIDWSQIKWDDKPLITIKLHGISRNVAVSSDWSLEALRATFFSNNVNTGLRTVQSTENKESQIVVSSSDVVVSPPSVKSKIQDRPAPPLSVPEKMNWPLIGRVSSKYGKRGRRQHTGIDIPKTKGSAILAVRDGVVADVSNTKDGRLKGYGNVVILRHDQQLSTLYAHCDTIKVKKGQSIKKGDLIGYVGRTGRATANLLHFEVRKANKPLDPLNFLSGT